MNEPDVSRTLSGGGVRLCRLLLLGGWIACAAATVADLFEARYTAICGPVILLLGLALLLCGCLVRNGLTIVTGISHCGVCLLFFGLVRLLHWGPDSAQVPFFWMGLLYSAFAAWLTRKTYRTLVAYKPWQCQHCGYVLFGLSEPRCPECGRPFSPTQMTDLWQQGQPPQVCPKDPGRG
jgi:hypothetical protein